MINHNEIICKINNLICKIELLSDNSIKFVDYNFNFVITNKINFSNSLLYFICYKNHKVLIGYFNIYESINLINLNILDYPELFFQIKLDLDNENNKSLISTTIKEFIIKIINLSNKIIDYNILIKNYFVSKELYPTSNKIYLKSIFYKKYCVILIKDGYFMLTYNDEIEDYYKINSFYSLLNHKKLKIFRKNIFCL